MQQLFLLIGTLLACHGIYLFVQRRIRCRTLPPKFWTFDPFMNFDWILPTALDARKQLALFDRYGLTYRLPKITNPMSAIVTCDPENYHAIITGKDWGVEFRKKGMGQMLGSGFLCTDGPEWMRCRKMLRPAFNRNNIDNFDVLGNVADDLISRIEEAQGKVDMASLLYDALMHSSMHFILGIDSKDQNDGRPIDAQTFEKLWQEGLLGMGIRLLLGGTISKLFLPKAHFTYVCNTLHSFIDFAIAKQETQTSSSERKTKPMAELVTAQAKDRAEARSQLMQTMLASQDTTGILTCNAIHLLAMHPDIWSKLRQEVLNAGPELMTWDGLRENTTVQNILLETLRLRPIFPQIGRFAICDTTLPTGGGPKHDQPLHIPKGTFAIPNSWGIHMNKNIYGADADEWKPDRWNGIKPTKKEYVPFGAGPRSCLGKEKALAEAAYLVVRLARRFEALEDRTGAWRPDASFTMKNKDGYKVTFSR